MEEPQATVGPEEDQEHVGGLIGRFQFFPRRAGFRSHSRTGSDPLHAVRHGSSSAIHWNQAAQATPKRHTNMLEACASSARL